MSYKESNDKDGGDYKVPAPVGFLAAASAATQLKAQPFGYIECDIDESFGATEYQANERSEILNSIKRGMTKMKMGIKTKIKVGSILCVCDRKTEYTCGQCCNRVLFGRIPTNLRGKKVKPIMARRPRRVQVQRRRTPPPNLHLRSTHYI
eukprot:GHVO01018301.1.p1 GENE.GHVO01018301.1~~GHVO01018301.1.p1  ORF type:complete len:150 (+),score=17.63 GHVO01018301.1:147-596(+)